MSKKELILLGCLIALIIGGPLYVLFVRDEPAAPAVVQTDQKQKDPVEQAEDLPLNAFDKAKFSLTDPTSIWVIANKQRPLVPTDYAPTDLVNVGGGQRLRAEAATKLSELIAGAKAAGLKINPLSAYRSYQTQVSVYNSEVRAYGQAVADSESARPGYSEHQTGLAIDVGGGGCGVEDCFGDTEEGKWVAANAHKYGFIIRYVPGKEAITGYRPEPWHIRYVGVELAAEMKKQGVQTLEEFFDLPAAPNY